MRFGERQVTLWGQVGNAFVVDLEMTLKSNRILAV
jgi:hypothetical protein